MSQWQNFSVWRGKLPHWRADDVNYYVTFRHRRPLTVDECIVLVDSLRRPDGRKWMIDIACVLPEQTEILVRIQPGPNGEPEELSDIVEKAKTRAGKTIVKRSGERFPPFYQESYDRIVRDEAEFEERYLSILSSPVDLEICEDAEDYPALWVPDKPS